mmetsp:Transcript_11332/g.14134  ORF Transcript_11332/g.14134 Transcript_11332/m.14134 type:complete len:214 (+) Transcript_11332:158-799(+)
MISNGNELDDNNHSEGLQVRSASIDTLSEDLEPETRICGCITQPREIGKSYLLWGPAYGSTFPFHCLIGPDYIGPIATLSSIFVLTLLWEYFVARDYVWAICLGVVSFFILLFIFAKAAFSDPGIVPRINDAGYGTNIQGSVQCPVCRINRPYGVKIQHCYRCDVCIQGLDHHCGWVGKCVGKKTYIWFQLFIGAAVIHFIMLIFIFILVLMF